MTLNLAGSDGSLALDLDRTPSTVFGKQMANIH